MSQYTIQTSLTRMTALLTGCAQDRTSDAENVQCCWCNATALQHHITMNRLWSYVRHIPFLQLQGSGTDIRVQLLASGVSCATLRPESTRWRGLRAIAAQELRRGIAAATGDTSCCF